MVPKTEKTPYMSLALLCRPIIFCYVQKACLRDARAAYWVILSIALSDQTNEPRLQRPFMGLAHHCSKANDPSERRVNPEDPLVGHPKLGALEQW